MQAEARGSAVKLDSLELVMRDLASLQADAQVELAGDWPLQLHDKLSLTMPNQPQLALVGEASGDLRRLLVKQVISGAVDAQLDAEASDLLGELRWQTRLQLSRLSDEVATLAREQAGVDLPDGLTLALNGDGDLQRANLAVDLELGTAQPWDTPSAATEARDSAASQTTTETKITTRLVSDGMGGGPDAAPDSDKSQLLPCCGNGSESGTRVRSMLPPQLSMRVVVSGCEPVVKVSCLSSPYRREIQSFQMKS